MATDFNYGNKTIDSSGPIKPSGKNQPLDPRTEVKLYADIESIPNPYISMIITVLEDETNSNKMTDYKVLSLKADNLGVANSVVDQVQRYVDYLGAGSVSQEDINTAVNNYLTEHPVSGGATAEQAAQIEANKTAIGDENSGLIKEINDIKNTELENLNTAIQTLETLVGVDETVGDKTGLPSGDANIIASINRIDKKTINSPIYEIQNKTLNFNGSNTIILSEDVQDCTCGIEFTIDNNSSDTTLNFTNLFPYNPLSSAPNTMSGIQGYLGTLEFIRDNIIKFTATGDNAIFQSVVSPENIIANHKYLYRSFISNDGGITYTTSKNTIVTANGDGTITIGTNIVFKVSGIANNSEIYIKNPLIIDLTEMYGQGSEPNADQMLINIPEDTWSNGTYPPSIEPQTFTITSKNSEGVVIDTYISSSEDKTLDIVSNGTIEADGNQPENTTLTNVKTKVLVSNSSSYSSKHEVNLNNVDRLLFLGDSYTEGMYYQKGKAWVCQLAEQLDYTCEGYGWGGYTSETLLGNIKNNLARYNPVPIKSLNPGKVMVMTFVNDMVKMSYDNTRYLNGIKNLAKEIEYLGAKPIICTEFRDPWGYGLQQNLNELCSQNGYDYFNILPFTKFLGITTASDDSSMSPYYNGSHPGQRTGGIITNQYLKYCKNLPRPISAIKIYRLREGITINNLTDLIFNNRRDKLLKFKEINIAHSALSNETDWDRLDNMTGTSTNGIISEYGQLMSNQNVAFNNYALVEVILPTTKKHIKSAKLIINDTSVSMYIKKQDGFVAISDGVVDDLVNSIEYDKITFLLYKNGGFNLNDIRLEWEGEEIPKHESPKNIIFPKNAVELLSANTFDTDNSWYTATGTISPTEPTNYAKMPQGCTKLITITDGNYINISKSITSNSIPGTVNNLRLRVVARYNPDKDSNLITENSYDRKQIKLELKGTTIEATVNRYTQFKELDMSWTMCEFDLTATDNIDINIMSEDSTPIEIAYISLLSY